VLRILLGKALLHDELDDYGQEGLKELGLLAEDLELALLEEEETVGSADLLGLGVDAGDLGVDEFGHDDFAGWGREYLRSV
jgi:hypothetical protein